jgi:WD40 repeat protein
VTPDGQRAVSASQDQTLKVWELGSGRELRTLTGHTNWVHAVAVTPDGQRAVSASDDNTLKVWDLETGAVLATFTCDSAAHGCAFADDGKLIVAGDAAGHVHFLRLEEPKPKN